MNMGGLIRRRRTHVQPFMITLILMSTTLRSRRMTMSLVIVILVDPCHFIHAFSIVSRHLVEAFAKNSKPKGFYETVLIALHTYADIFSEPAFDVLPQHCKWDHAIELECEPSPGFRKVYLMTQ
jgi:hypothetical protein